MGVLQHNHTNATAKADIRAGQSDHCIRSGASNWKRPPGYTTRRDVTWPRTCWPASLCTVCFGARRQFSPLIPQLRWVAGMERANGVRSSLDIKESSQRAP